jgi:hypothetical protein
MNFHQILAPPKQQEIQFHETQTDQSQIHNSTIQKWPIGHGQS